MRARDLLIYKLIYKMMSYPRKCYYKKYQKRLKNKSPSLITSDCLGGIIYHNLGLKFMSPTINLYIEPKEFVTFVHNLKGFMESDVIEIKAENKKFPVGQIEYNGKKVTLNFMHYNSFEEAKNKWDERKLRIDYSNIYIAQIIVDATKEDFEAFESLPYENKILITKENLTNSKNVTTLKIFSKKKYKPGEGFHYKNWFSIKRHIDEWDYVEFLNKSNK